MRHKSKKELQTKRERSSALWQRRPLMPNNTPPLTPEEWERLEKLGMFPGVWGDYVHHNHEGVCTHPSCLSIRAIRQLQSENAAKGARIRELEAELVKIHPGAISAPSLPHLPFTTREISGRVYLAHMSNTIIGPKGSRPDDFILDAGIAPAVELLRSAGVETFESCEGGEGHAFPVPTVRFHGERPEGFRALAVAMQNGLSVVELRRVWPVNDGEPIGPWWELTFAPTKSVSHA